MLIDSHCHLDFPDFQYDLDQVVDRAQKAGVGHFLTICTHLSKFEQVKTVAEKYSEIMHCTLGIHPHEAENEPTATAEALVEMADKEPKIVAFGETGLDFHYENSPITIQEAQFRTHIQAARTANLPVIIHTRDADDDTIRILQEEMEIGKFKGVIHCFTSGSEFAEKCVELGLYISFSGIITFKNAEEIRNIAKNIPLNRLLVETDSPYLAPVPNRGKRNEPSYVTHTAAKLSEILNVNNEQIASQTTENFFNLFTKTQE